MGCLGMCLRVLLWLAVLSAVTTRTRVPAADEAVCDKEGKKGLEYYDHPSNETVKGVMDAFSFPDCDGTDGLLMLMAGKCMKKTAFCVPLEGLANSKCNEYISGDEPRACNNLIRVLIYGFVSREDKFPGIFSKTVEQFADGPNDPLLQSLNDVCNDEQASKKVVKETCSTLGGWIYALNDTALAMEIPDTLQEHINSLTGKYSKSAIRHFKRSWQPSDIPTLYEEQCGSAPKPSSGPDVYCEVLKEKLEAYNKECARDPSKCNKKEEEEKSGVRILSLTLPRLLFCILINFI